MNYNLKTIKTSMQSETQRKKRKMYNNLLPAIGQILPGFVGYFLLIVILMKDAEELLHSFELTQQEFFNIFEKNILFAT